MAELLSFEQIAAVDDITEEVIEIPEWKGAVKVRSLTRQQVKEISKAATKRLSKNKTEFQADVFEKGLVFFGLVHPQITEEQYEVLLRKNQGPMQRIVSKIMEISNMNDDEETAEAAEKAEEGLFSEGARIVPRVPASGDAGNDTRGTNDGNAPSA